MPATGITRANENRRIRQEALREQLSNKQLLQQVILIAEKLEDLDGKINPENSEIDALKITRLKHSADLKLKLVNKYLPDLKAMEMDMDNGSGPVQVHVIKLADADVEYIPSA
jgi:hypothetical protein